MSVISDLENILVYGSYPETLTMPNNKDRAEYLINLRNSYLLKDILEQENLRNPSKLFDLLRLLAYQIGNEVSLNELSNQLAIAKQTIERYILPSGESFYYYEGPGFFTQSKKGNFKNAPLLFLG